MIPKLVRLEPAEGPGRVADRHGRVVVIDVCLVIIVILTFCNLLMTDFWSFVIVRSLMNIVAGLMWGALGGLTRDMSRAESREQDAFRHSTLGLRPSAPIQAEAGDRGHPLSRAFSVRAADAGRNRDPAGAAVHLSPERRSQRGALSGASARGYLP